MSSIKKYLFVVLYSLTANFVFADQAPKDVSVDCGENSCEQVYKEMKVFAKNGSPHAQAVLALFYRGGHGVETDTDRSIVYMKRAAKNGLAFAQYDLAILYRAGYLVEKNQQEGDIWLEKSAKGGYKPAIALMLSENTMTQNEALKIIGTEEPTLAEGEGLLTITKSKYSMTDLIDYLRSLGYGRTVRTGSRIPGLGCGNMSNCDVWDINSPVGIAQFSALVGNINLAATAVEMNSRVK